MKIGIPKEVKDNEYRIGATPAMVKTLIKEGHEVLVQKGGGSKIGFKDEDYEKAGAKIIVVPEEVYAAEMIIKVKEPQPSEYLLLKEDQILFCYLHLAPDPKQMAPLLKQKVVGIAFETVVDHNGRLPLLHGSVIVDVAIDQGGCAETSRPATHFDPTFVQNDIVHYCVANMPGACARTATIALANSILSYALRIAMMGYKQALLSDPLFMQGLNVCLRKVTNEHVAHDLKYDFHDPEEVLKSL